MPAVHGSPPPRPASATPWAWIDTAADLLALVQQLRQAPRFALDTESNSMHAYRERICLVQVSLPDRDVLVDPLAVDLGPLREVLADPAIEKVMHGADYDVLCLKREYGLELAGLYDTMLAARVLGWSSHGLGPILQERYGFAANKRMQRFDWRRRPLPAEALDYARHDTRFLLDLRDQQHRELLAVGREDELRHACLRQTRVEPRPSRADALGMWRIKGARGLPPSARAVLRALHELREAVAEELDRPVFQVMSDAILLALARHPPDDEAAVQAIRGLHPALRGRGRTRVLEAIEAGRQSEPPRPPPVDRGPAREVVARFDALRAWRQAVAAERALPPDLVLGKDALMALAVADPRTPEALRDSGALDEWERERYGAGVLRVLRGC